MNKSRSPSEEDLIAGHKRVINEIKQAFYFLNTDSAEDVKKFADTLHNAITGMLELNYQVEHEAMYPELTKAIHQLLLHTDDTYSNDATMIKDAPYDPLQKLEKMHTLLTQFINPTSEAPNMSEAQSEYESSEREVITSETISEYMLTKLREFRDLHDGPEDDEGKKTHFYKHKETEPYIEKDGEKIIKLAIYVENTPEDVLRQWIRDVYQKAERSRVRYNQDHFIVYTSDMDEVEIINKKRTLKTDLNSYEDGTIMLWGKLANHLLEFALQAPNRNSLESAETENHQEILESIKAQLPTYRDTLFLPKGQNKKTYIYPPHTNQVYSDKVGLSGNKILARKFYVEPGQIPVNQEEVEKIETQTDEAIENLWEKIAEETGRQYKFSKQTIIMKGFNFSPENDVLTIAGKTYDTGLSDYDFGTRMIHGSTANHLLNELLQRPYIMAQIDEINQSDSDEQTFPSENIKEGPIASEEESEDNNKRKRPGHDSVIEEEVNTNTPPKKVKKQKNQETENIWGNENHPIDVDLYDSEEAKEEISDNKEQMQEEQRKLQEEQERYEATRRTFALLNSQKRNLWEKMRKESRDDLNETREKRKDLASKNNDLEEKIKRLKAEIGDGRLRM